MEISIKADVHVIDTIEEDLNEDVEQQDTITCKDQQPNKQPNRDQQSNKQPDKQLIMDQQPSKQQNMDQQPNIDQQPNEQPNMDQQPKEQPNMDQQPNEQPNMDQQPNEQPNMHQQPNEQPNMHQQPNIAGQQMNVTSYPSGSQNDHVSDTSDITINTVDCNIMVVQNDNTETDNVNTMEEQENLYDFPEQLVPANISTYMSNSTMTSNTVEEVVMGVDKIVLNYPSTSSSETTKNKYKKGANSTKHSKCNRPDGSGVFIEDHSREYIDVKLKKTGGMLGFSITSVQVKNTCRTFK